MRRAKEFLFPDGKFDNVACLAVFDATYQNVALSEFLRVLRVGGILYLTGKNDTYPKDDELAFKAEKGARKKNHPNYFTDVKAMLRQLDGHGQRLVASYFFPRRGDFGKLRYVTKMPSAFYEYFIVVKKKASAAPFSPFSDGMSKTFQQLQS